MASTAVIYVGGELGRQAAPQLADDVEVAVAADSGLAVARGLRRRVDAVVGDLDSVRMEDLEAAEAEGAVVIRHEPDKDHTDLELAVDLVRRRGVERLVVIGGAAGRLDHLAANLAALCAPSLEDLEVDAWIGEARMTVVRDTTRLDGRPGLLVSLLAWGGPAVGVSTDGLRWPLSDAVLAVGSGWGTSNEFEAERAEVRVRSGVLTAICPDVSSICPIVDLGTVDLGTVDLH